MYKYALTLLTVAALAAPAHAKDKEPEQPPPPPPPPTCNLVVDPIGDTPVQTTHLDIVSGDVATDATRVYGVVRVRSLSGSDPIVALGARWDLSFSVFNSRYTFTARRDATGASVATLSRDVAGTPVVVAPATLSFDVTSGEIAWSTTRKAVTELGATIGKASLFGLTARTYAGPAETVVDSAGPMGRYPDGHPSCITA